MTTNQYAYHYTTNGTAARPQPEGQLLTEKLFRARDSSIERNLSPAPLPPVWAEDLLRIAKAAYLADKLSSRKSASDRWTRAISLSIQLVEPDPWLHHAEPLVTSLLETLTADRWDIRFHPGAASHRGVAGWLFDDETADEVALFSGGLDSTAYAAQQAGATGGPLLLISYYDPALKRRQEEIFEAIRRLGARQLMHRPVLLQSRANGESLEPSSRSRGLLFLSTAVYAAAAHRARRVAVPENGQLAVNPPLTRARPASCSTRSVHPRTMHLVNQLIASVGGDIEVVNPLLSDTKGEVCRRGRDAGLPLATLMTTVSCGHPPRNYGASRMDHCGHCFPCLIRQSGLLAGLGRDDTPYERDVWARQPAGKDIARDRRALAAWLAADFGVRDLTTDLPLPPQTSPTALLRTLERGREELRSLFAHRHASGVPLPRAA
ncbi:7-cyano-7-deazaguanine synthase [Micromonospora sp. KLBMP9576]|uniref:7-cyano-7-deazaguanine synthase n=1 Tax=Micromonospora sp. KLBMP9576 TaxID=3424769 RepID=UPI003D8CC660